MWHCDHLASKSTYPTDNELSLMQRFKKSVISNGLFISNQ